MKKFVMTTFYPYQWDLNYANPDVFNIMVDNLLNLANHGVDVLRIDAVPYIWKELGTSCRNLPKVHTIVRMLRMICEIVCPGVLLLGESGVGKSETAIELVKRGHRLIADDAVEIKRNVTDRLVGTAPELIRHYIELRGIGVIDVCRLFGMSAVKDEAEIDMVINLEQWKDGAMYDRLGLENLYTTILDVQVPSLTVPVRPGRNLAVIIEVAAMNNRHKKMGYNAAVEFTKQINQHFDQAMSAQLNDN